MRLQGTILQINQPAQYNELNIVTIIKARRMRLLIQHKHIYKIFKTSETDAKQRLMAQM